MCQSLARPDPQFCQQFGVSREKLLATPEASACAAYARYILDVGAQGDVLDLYMAVASCLVGYGEVGLWLRKRVAMGEAKIEGNTYAKWINDYSGEDFLAAVNRGIGQSHRVGCAAREAHSLRKPGEARGAGPADARKAREADGHLARMCPPRARFLGNGHEAALVDTS